MKIGDFRTQMAEALKKLREADTDEARTEATNAIATLETEAAKIDAPAATQAPDSIEALTESAPALLEQIRESVKKDVGTEVAELQAQLTETRGKLSEADAFIGGLTGVREIAGHLREAGVEDADELKYYVGLARDRKLTSKEDITDMVETDRKFAKKRETALMSSIREALGDVDLPEVEGILGRKPDAPSDGGVALLREAGIPVKEPVTA